MGHAGALYARPDGRIFDLRRPASPKQTVEPPARPPEGVQITIGSGGTVSGSQITFGDVTGRDIVKGNIFDERWLDSG